MSLDALFEALQASLASNSDLPDRCAYIRADSSVALNMPHDPLCDLFDRAPQAGFAISERTMDLQEAALKHEIQQLDAKIGHGTDHVQHYTERSLRFERRLHSLTAHLDLEAQIGSCKAECSQSLCDSSCATLIQDAIGDCVKGGSLATQSALLLNNSLEQKLQVSKENLRWHCFCERLVEDSGRSVVLTDLNSADGDCTKLRASLTAVVRDRIGSKIEAEVLVRRIVRISYNNKPPSSFSVADAQPARGKEGKRRATRACRQSTSVGQLLGNLILGVPWPLSADETATRRVHTRRYPRDFHRVTAFDGDMPLTTKVLAWVRAVDDGDVDFSVFYCVEERLAAFSRREQQVFPANSLFPSLNIRMDDKISTFVSHSPSFSNFRVLNQSVGLDNVVMASSPVEYNERVTVHFARASLRHLIEAYHGEDSALEENYPSSQFPRACLKNLYALVKPHSKNSTVSPHMQALSPTEFSELVTVYLLRSGNALTSELVFPDPSLTARDRPQGTVALQYAYALVYPVPPAELRGIKLVLPEYFVQYEESSPANAAVMLFNAVGFEEEHAMVPRVAYCSWVGCHEPVPLRSQQWTTDPHRPCTNLCVTHSWIVNRPVKPPFQLHRYYANGASLKAPASEVPQRTKSLGAFLSDAPCSAVKMSPVFRALLAGSLPPTINNFMLKGAQVSLDERSPLDSPTKRSSGSSNFEEEVHAEEIHLRRRLQQEKACYAALLAEGGTPMPTDRLVFATKTAKTLATPSVVQSRRPASTGRQRKGTL